MVERKDNSRPGGKRLAILVTTKVEWIAFGADYARRDNGNRIGICRLFDQLDELELPAAHSTNSLIYE